MIRELQNLNQVLEIGGIMTVQIKWRFVAVFAVFVQFFVTAGPVYNYNVFFVDLQEEFKTSAVITGWVGSLGSALFCAVVPLAAVVGTMIGNLRLVFLGTILASAGYMSTSFIPSLEYGFLTFGAMVGLGSSLANCAAGSLLLDWYSGREDNCRATGGALVGTSFGVMVFGPLLNTLSAAYGWRNCFRILSGIVLVLGLAGAVPFFKSPESQQTQSDDSLRNQTVFSAEEQMAEGSSELEADQGQQPDSSKEPDTKSIHDGDGNRRVIRLLLNTEMWLWISSITLSQFGWSFVILNYSSFMEGIGLSTNEVSLALTVFGATEVGSKIFFAVFGDRLPCLKLYVIAASSICAAIISGFLTLSSNFLHMIILSTAWGIFRGGTYGACFAAGDELFGSYGSRVVTSVVLLGFGLGILGSPITDGLYDLTGDYTSSLFVLMATFVLSALSMLLIPAKRKMQSRWRCCQSSTSRQEDSSCTDASCVVGTSDVNIRQVGYSNAAYEVEI